MVRLSEVRTVPSFLVENRSSKLDCNVYVVPSNEAQSLVNGTAQKVALRMSMAQGHIRISKAVSAEVKTGVAVAATLTWRAGSDL